MSEEEILADFITFNDPYIEQIKAASPELSKAIKEVLGEIFAKYTGIKIEGATEEESEIPLNSYSKGEMVETMSGKWQGAAEIISLEWDKTENSWKYQVVYGKEPNETYNNDLEENLYAAQTEEIEETEYTLMSDKELEAALLENKELIEIYDDPIDPDQIEAQDAIQEIELEIERRNNK